MNLLVNFLNLIENKARKFRLEIGVNCSTINFYRTRLFIFQGGRLKMLVSGLHMAALSLGDEKIEMEGGKTVPTRSDRQEKLEKIRTAFLNRLHANRPWAYYLSFCEILNLINVLAQIYITDLFLGGAFMGLGQQVAQTRFGEIMDPLDIVFPKMTKCTFHKYGPSGTIQKHDALCVMALNIVNEKTYTFLWFWFIILAIVTGLGLVWRILTMLLHARFVHSFFSLLLHLL